MLALFFQIVTWVACIWSGLIVLLSGIMSYLYEGSIEQIIDRLERKRRSFACGGSFVVFVVSGALLIAYYFS